MSLSPAFMSRLSRALFEIGPGPDTLLVLEDEEFKRELNAAKYFRFIEYQGYMVMPLDVLGSRVFVTCERLRVNKAAWEN